ncbi:MULTISPECIES: hypothetical protein [unclassified Corallococcus]|uniref:hypothetical protein n=1 Tax=unclassified Corallococcus TaxID=2685029 RepID=UPI001A8E4534|nr:MULTISPECIES: hypothetical protein [unclassified Corallococcus]MBN9686155.1 hypothetical protein [Corallococcus sp. NCSPR001]WAS82413.1 hypothetical protein O0N60_24145 [Corallococcus sp. NCRR]
MSLELLLAHADTREPVLCPGFDDSVLRNPPSLHGISPPKYLWSDAGDLDDFPAQRWGIVYPRGPEGERLLELIAPLRELRQEEQGGEVRVYAVPSGLDREAAHRWKERHFDTENGQEQDRPRYVLILGDLDAVSLEFQQVLATNALVGRLVFPSEDGYRAYVQKVVRWARTPSDVERAQTLFYTARDHTDATRIGHDQLMVPSVEECRRLQREGRLPADPPRHWIEQGIGQDSAVARFLEFARGAEPSVLFSLSHGLGQPKGRNWNSAEEQRARQGALLLPQDELLCAEDVATVPFLPGGIWLCFACFSGGTPEQSAYASWFHDLEPREAALVKALMRPHKDSPFIAALPQAALSNPEGPLAVLGHVDLAWTQSFNDRGRSRFMRFAGFIQALAKRRRVGAAMAGILKAVAETGAALTSSYHQQRKALMSGQTYAGSPAEQADRWMLYHDLSSFVLLGDPAVQLPLRRR